MRFGRDVLATVVTLIGVVVGFSVTQGWNWPIVGNSVAYGIVAAGVISIVACVASGWMNRLGDSTVYRDPWMITAMLLGTATFVVGVTGLFVGATLYLYMVLAGIVLLWLVSTAHHLLVPEPTAGRHLPTPA